MLDKRLIKSYVWHGEDCFFVSTIYRGSSAMLGPRRFSETIVWKYDYEKAARGEQIYMDGGLEGSIRVHLSICDRIAKTGSPEEAEDV